MGTQDPPFNSVPPTNREAVFHDGIASTAGKESDILPTVSTGILVAVHMSIIPCLLAQRAVVLSPVPWDSQIRR